MLIRKIEGERLVYEARRPRKGSRWHRVDLEAFDGNGDCGCEDFRCRKGPALRDRRRALSRKAFRRLPPTWCVHLEAVHRRFSQDMLRAIIDEMATAHPDNRPSPHNRHD
jgi:hypothetical protein